MKVLFLTHRLPYAANRGDRIRARHLLRFLSRHVDVHLLSFVHSDEEAAHAADLRDLARSVTVQRVPRFRNYPRAVHALLTGQPLTHALLHASSIHQACRRVFDEHRPDVVLATGSGMARFALSPPLDRLPMVLDMVDVDSEKWRALGGSARPPLAWVYRAEARTLSAFEARAARAAHAVLVVNERERAAMLRIEPAARVVVVPIGVPLDDLRPPVPPADGQNVVFCGVMNYRPNEEGTLWFAQHVWPLVRQRHPHARFTIVGSDPTRALRRLPETDPSIAVTGRVDEVRSYLWNASLSVAPLLLARGVQNKVLEAVAAGLPCVLTPAVRDGLPEAVLAACRVAATPAQFAEEVSSLLALSPDERRAVAGQADLRTLGWADQLTPVLDLLTGARVGASAALRSDVA